MTKQTTFDRHLAAIRSGTVDKTNVIGLRKAINHAERLRNGWSGNRSSLTVEQADVLEIALEQHEPRIAGELHDTGVKLLRSKRYAKRWGNRERHVIGQLDHFELVEFDRIGHRGAYAVPVYRACAVDGSSFVFRNIPWQSGGNGPEIVG